MPKSAWVPDRRDIVWIECSPQIGREMKDRHPLLVLSPRAFNEKTGLVIGLPMTTAAYNETNPFAIKLEGVGKLSAYILAHQPKSFDWRGRHAKPHPWKQAPPDAFAAACEQLNQIVCLCG
ncbi:type II toxin-antitoxin system PemK/MazF family toxin [Cupriavidus sp. DB3]|uniref:type II toxin-antitoxin system PemK/MazF family toxin n=1 Tax=Cupriavidus sp. DB3 TaxID=2873259 RepID=UPI001CF346D6|nr:type II toxin-antitoxin system PemK/MazF family toxin [Cupriavidus sp. DB3]MCA7085367.1 type II toxin-antitoxin system PemK/MazF family toxin [Cupriavidus sp. DB3]